MRNSLVETKISPLQPHCFLPPPPDTRRLRSNLHTPQRQFERAEMPRAAVGFSGMPASVTAPEGATPAATPSPDGRTSRQAPLKGGLPSALDTIHSDASEHVRANTHTRRWHTDTPPATVALRRYTGCTHKHSRHEEPLSLSRQAADAASQLTGHASEGRKTLGPRHQDSLSMRPPHSCHAGSRRHQRHRRLMQFCFHPTLWLTSLLPTPPHRCRTLAFRCLRTVVQTAPQQDSCIHWLSVRLPHFSTLTS